MVPSTRKKEYPEQAAVQLFSHLSEGAYTTFSKAIKELVNNAFDADATTVNLHFNEDFSELTITDDGDGISAEKLRSEFLRIGGSRRRLEERNRKFSRPVIGKFGIGFLSVARLCDSVTVYSKEKGTDFVLSWEIPLRHLFDPDLQLKNLRNEYYYYSLPMISNKAKNQSYTKIVLSGLRTDITQDLKSGPKSKNQWITVDDLPGLERFKWEIGECLPVQYRTDFPVFKHKDDLLLQIKSELSKFNFRVYLNGEEVLKPICLARQYFKGAKWNYEGLNVPVSEYDIFIVESPPTASLRFYGYFYNQSKQIQPVSLRGILLRINHVGVKGFSKSFYEYPRNIGPIQAAISGEIFLDSTFEDVLTLDKDDFKEDHPKFKEVMGYIHNKIDEIATVSRSRSRAAKGGKKRKPLPKVKDLDLSSKEIKVAERIIGKKTFKKEYFPNINLSIKTNTKNLRTTVENLIGKTLDSDEGDYLLESLDCLESV